MKPREFWIGITGDPNKLLDEERFVYLKEPVEIPGEDLIHVVELVEDECQLIIDLISQRSVAFDESKKYRGLAEELAKELQLLKDQEGKK